MIASTLLLCLSMLTPGTIADTIPDEKMVFVDRSRMPQFPGGMDSLNAYFGRVARYPPEALAAGRQGTVCVLFVLRQDSSISDISVDGVNPGFGMDAEAVRLVKLMPKWKPALQGGRPVHCYWRLNFQFNLQNRSIAVDEFPPDIIFTYLEIPPYFPGGEAAFHMFLSQNLAYPAEAKAHGIQGTVRVAYVNTRFRVKTNIHVVSPRLGHGIEEEALRLVSSMPPMKGSTNGGRRVAAYDTLDIPFKLP
ncbi:TonB family protein [Chitinophaga sp. NPDC101104]|uniref:TonB family protein n=1 Tax=Chitinophaga sp. NPDC101104 TaxID=3390561 RepID=UPI003D094897